MENRKEICNKISRNIGELKMDYCFHEVDAGEETVAIAYKDQHVGIFLKSSRDSFVSDMNNAFALSYGVKLTFLYDRLKKSEELIDAYRLKIQKVSTDYTSVKETDVNEFLTSL